MLVEAEIVVPCQVGDIFRAARDEIVHTNDLVSSLR
jgi:hypothetical protein